MCSFHLTADIVKPIIKAVISWLVNQTPLLLNEVKKLLLNVLQELPEFVQVVLVGVKEGLQKAMELLNSIKDVVVSFCRSNKKLISNATKVGIKIVLREAVVRFGVSKAVKYGARKVSSQAAKRVVKVANPAAIVVDVAQFGLETAGYEKAGKTVGLMGNIGTGAVAGGVVAGPIGAAVGAAGGLVTWGIGEAAGSAINYFMS